MNLSPIEKAKMLYETTTLSPAEIGAQVGEDSLRIRKWIKNRHWIKNRFVDNLQKEIDGIIESKVNVQEGTEEFKLVTHEEPKTAEEIIALLKLDTTKWKLSSYWNKKQLNGTWLISALVSSLKGQNRVIQDLGEIIKNYKTPYKPIQEKDVLNNTQYARECMALISLPDAHIDKRDIKGTLIQERLDNYISVLDSLLYQTFNSKNIEEVVFLLGNDLFQTDTFHNTTTKGTPVATDTPWDKSYEHGFELMVTAINRCRQFCKKLYIYLVQGNHPRTKEYYLAHALELYFKSDPNIVFNRTSDNLKVHQYGDTLLCFNHGNNINDKLPLAFATTFYKQWGSSKYKEIILGDKHHNSEKLYKIQGEAQGVRMRILPSLSGTDQWHEDELFINSIQSGVVFVYDKEKGKVAEYEERI